MLVYIFGVWLNLHTIVHLNEHDGVCTIYTTGKYVHEVKHACGDVAKKINDASAKTNCVGNN